MKTPPTGAGIAKAFMENRAKLVSIASRFLKNRADAEDIAQEAFVKSYQHILDDKVDNPNAYFVQATKNLAIKRNNLAHNKLSDHLEEADLSGYISEENQLERDIEAKEEMHALMEILKQLPPQCRKVFVLKKIYGHSHREIAKEMKISENTVHQHLAKGLARCTQAMTKKGYSRSAKTNRAKIS
jgi:RNA polymerase sigma-70 factor (ECF subfamily)